MGTFGRGDRSRDDRGSRGSRQQGRRPSGGAREAGASRGSFSTTKYDAVCSTCQKECKVPFRPSGGRPVLCNDCFGSQEKSGRSDFKRSSASPSKFKSRDYADRRPRDNGDRPQISAGANRDLLDKINTKLDAILQILNGS